MNDSVLISVGLPIALAIIMFGLGLSLGIAYLISSVISIWVLRRRYSQDLSISALSRETVFIGLSAAVAGTCVWGLMSAIDAHLWSGITGILGSVAMSAVLLAIYAGCTLIFRVNLRSLRTLTH